MLIHFLRQSSPKNKYGMNYHDHSYLYIYDEERAMYRELWLEATERKWLSKGDSEYIRNNFDYMMYPDETDYLMDQFNYEDEHFDEYETIEVDKDEEDWDQEMAKELEEKARGV